ncbi:MAG: type II toxin-antitoxin system HipA family toxin [Candidatus Erginobacter occultus]|nr:type II toxin-antitoxin system HipA family toxin [Candidatus Erginobacter occultus]
MSALMVYLNSERVGRLEEDAGGELRFSYDQVWLEKPGALPLSRSLPLRSADFTGKQARAFFAGLLPEEEPRRQIAKILGISVSNDFAMLAGIGGECAGAVSLLPEGEVPPDAAGGRHRRLTEPEVQGIVAELPRWPLLAGQDGLRLSLAGARDKLPVIVQNKAISLPLGNTPSTHILKPEPDRFSGLAVNEMFCMTLARAVGLDVPDIIFRRVGEKPCLLVERYDRVTDEAGVTIRIHQEDFCQALGLPPERKYQAEGGPTLSDCIALLRDWSTAPVLDISAFINGLIFNVLIGNTDAHGKNYSLLYSGRERRLAPLYDLVSTLSWPELSRTLAMKIGGCDSIHAFSLGDWKKMAGKSGLGWPMLRERMAKNCQAVLSKLDIVRQLTGNHGEETAQKLEKNIGYRSSKMLEALSRKK